MEEKTSPEKEQVKKKSLFGRILKWTGLFLLAILLSCAGFICWAFQTSGGQAWLMKTVNAALAPKEAGEASYRLTSLSGSLPFNFELGIEADDGKGVWLAAPKNIFRLDWHKLPGAVQIDALKVYDADLKRLPEFPPDKTPPPESKPFTLADLRDLLAKAHAFLSEKHWWLPQIRLENAGLENALLPSDLLPQKGEARSALNLDLSARFEDNAPAAKVILNLANADGSALDFGSIEIAGCRVDLDLSGSPDAGGLEARLDGKIAAGQPKLHLQDVPENLLGDAIGLDLAVSAKAGTSPEKPFLNAALSGPNLAAGGNHLKIAGKWDSGPGWKEGKLDGPLNLDLKLEVPPVEGVDEASPLAILKAPLTLAIAAKGDFPVMALELNLACDGLEKDGVRFEKGQVSIASGELDIPLDQNAILRLEKENQIGLKVSGILNNESVALSTEAFLQALPSKDDRKAWRAGARNLSLSVPGATLTGDAAAILLPDEKPFIDGNLKLEAANLADFEKFVPGQKFGGSVEAKISASALPGNDPGRKLEPGEPVDVAQARQTAGIILSSPKLSWAPASGDGVSLERLRANVETVNPLGDLTLKAAVEAARIVAAGLTLAPKIRAEGALKGPLNVEADVKGSVEAKLAAQWKPGSVVVSQLSARMDSAALMKPAPGQKGMMLGVQAANPMEVGYGEGGLKVRNVNINILPSGRLKADGALAPDKLDLDVSLENLAFKPWQALAPQIPQGSANLRASLKGTPQRPGGQFRLDLQNVKIPGSPLAPVSLALAGGVRNSALGLQLEIAPETLKTLGGSEARVAAQIPLSFGADGVPRPNMTAPLAASVRWEGALGPLWNLVPVADQRLNGRVDVNLAASGTLAAPRIRGGVKIDKGRYENILFGVLLTEIALRLDLTEDGPLKKTGSGGSGLPGGMTLALSLTDGRGGTVKVNGKSALNGDNLDIKARIDRLKPLRRRDIHVELSGEAAVKGSAGAPNVSGELVVNRGEVLLDNLDIASTSVTTLTITDPAEEKKKKEKAQSSPSSGVGSLNVRVTMLPRFTVEGRGLGSIWAANLLIQGALNDPKITGNIHSVSGNFDFLGKNFALTKGSVTFAGGSPANPLLNVELTNETPDLVAHIIISGPVNRLRLTLTSDPTLPRDDILSRVLFGKSINDLSRLEALQLAAAVAQLAGFGSGGSGVLNFAKKALGVDVLRVGTSSSNAAGEDDGAGGTTVEMGKYLTDTIYMGVQQGLKPDSTAFIIQLELTPRTSLEVRTEQNSTWGGLNWKYDY